MEYNIQATTYSFEYGKFINKREYTLIVFNTLEDAEAHVVSLRESCFLRDLFRNPDRNALVVRGRYRIVKTKQYE